MNSTGKDERGEYEWEECRECEGEGFVYEHGFKESCPHGCNRGMIKVYDHEEDDYECGFCLDAGCSACCPPADESPLCPPAQTESEGSGEIVIPW